MSAIKIIASLMIIFFHSHILVDAQCYNLVRQYFECRNLTMHSVAATGSFGIQTKKYMPVSRMANNFLDDEFFAKELANLDIDAALALFQTIFATTSDSSCTSEFCECVRSGIEDKRNRYAMLFTEKSFIEQVKNIMAEFNQKYANDPIDSDIEHFKLPSLKKFCSLYDFSTERFWFRSTTLPCLNHKINSEASFIECATPLLKDASLRTIFTQDFSLLDADKQEKIAVCDIQRSSITTCSLEAQRFFSLTTLARFSPQLFANKLAANTIKSFADSLIEKVRNYKASEEYGELSFRFPFPVWLSTSRVHIKSMNETLYRCTINATSNDVVLFNSSKLTIKASWSLVNNKLVRFESFQLAFKYKEDQASPDFVRNIFFLNENAPIIDCSIQDVENPLDQSWIRILSTKDMFNRLYIVAEQRSNLLITMNTNSIVVVAPLALIQNSNGILVKGCGL